MNKIISLRGGFTITEIIFTLSILGVIIFAVNSIFNPLTKLAERKDERKKSDLLEIQTAIEKYYDDFRKYPAHSKEDPQYRIIRQDGTTVDWGREWVPYIKILPKDSDSSKLYRYIVSSDRQQYWLYASLERAGEDAGACKHKVSACEGNPFGIECQCTNIPVGVFCGDSKDYCTYGVSSGNTSP